MEIRPGRSLVMIVHSGLTVIQGPGQSRNDLWFRGPVSGPEPSLWSRALHTQYIGGRWGMDWGSLGDRSGINLGWFYNGFVRFWVVFLMFFHCFVPTNDPKNHGKS